MTYTVCYLPQHINCQGLVLRIFTDHWSTRSKGPVDNALGDVMDLRVHNSYITSGILVPILVSMGPVGGLFLNKGTHEIMHYHELQVRLIQLIDVVDHFLYHESLTNLSLGWTPIHQDLGIESTSLHPVLFG